MKRQRWIGVGIGVVVLLVLAAIMVAVFTGDEAKNQPPQDGSLLNEAESRDASGGMNAATLKGSAGAPEATKSGSGLPQLELKVIKTALMKMEMGRGDYVKLREDAVALVVSVEGYVEAESSSRNDEGLTYATLTLRIPAQNFDDVLSQVSAMGNVLSTQVSTKDVSGEYVDLEGRLGHLQAEEAFYLALIGKASKVEEMISIQGHLSSVQAEKEQVQGRMNFLSQQIEYSTLTLSVDEVSGAVKDSGFGNSVTKAFGSFGKGVRAISIGFLYALPYLVILIVIGMVVWLIVRRKSRRGSNPEGGVARDDSATAS